jgi:RecQ family ATP-dependent DNA helicase
VYITPEKLSSWYDGLEAMARNSRLLYVAIDESHCVSEWGQDFRPDYRQLHRIRAILPETPIMALTATATERTRADIETHLRLRNVAAFVSSFNRPNLTYCVQPARSGDFDVVKLVAEANGPSIVYVLTQQQAEGVARALSASSRKIRAEPYHAGLSDVRRQNTHAKFLQGTIDCVVATIAFGMGVDKPDIRLVVHYGLTKSIETYYQQTGRAGRDGLPSKCVMLFSSRDVPLLRSIVTPAPTMHGQLDGIQLMQRYAMLTSTSETPCRRQFLLNHFNETPPAAPGRGCCDLCDERLAPERSPAMQVDLGREVFLLLQTVCDTGERYGVKVPVLALRGSSDKRVETARAHGNVRFWGKGRDHSEEWWIALAMQCQVHSLLRSQPTLMNRVSYDRIVVTDEGWRFVRGATAESATYPMTLTDEMLRLYLLENRQAREELAAAVAAPPSRSATATATAVAGPAPPPPQAASTPAATLIQHLTQSAAEDDERYELRKKLTQLRYRLATQLDRKPYEILSSSGLIALVEQLPRSADELAEMPGWENTRIERYGQQFIDVRIFGVCVEGCRMLHEGYM